MITDRGHAFLTVLLVIGSPSCEQVSVPPVDATPPTVKLDIYGIGDPTENPVSEDSSCCTIRRSVPERNQLTLVASAEDRDSGVKTLALNAAVIRTCQAQSAPGVPVGTPIMEVTMIELAKVASTGTQFPATRLENAYFRYGDHQPPECPHSKRYIDDANGTRVEDGLPQITTFCGVRLTATGENGTGVAASTGTLLLVAGPPRSGAFPCPSVPF